MHISASTLTGNNVVNHHDEDLGKVEDLMIDTTSGNVDYAVLSFGGALGIGNKLFAIPMDALEIDTDKKSCILNIEKDRLKDAPGFDKDNWPNTADAKWQSTIRNYYNA